MPFVAIRQEKSGRNTLFITDDFKQYTLSDLLNKKKSLPGIQFITSKIRSSYIRSIPNTDQTNNLDKIAITCNSGDYLLFDRKFLYLKALNGRVKKQWEAFSGNKTATLADQDKADFGPLPEGEYIVYFDKTLDFKNNEGLFDALKWIKKSPNWGFVATPLEQVSGKSYQRGDFYIHGGIQRGTKGCIELNNFANGRFYSFMVLYNRSFKLIVRYSK